MVETTDVIPLDQEEILTKLREMRYVEGGHKRLKDALLCDKNIERAWWGKDHSASDESKKQLGALVRHLHTSGHIVKCGPGSTVFTVGLKDVSSQ